jgi:uncharacterized membrane protein
MVAFNTALVNFLLFLHIMAAIVAFGPTFVFPIIMGMARKDPAHMEFGVRVIHAIASKVTKLGAIAAGILGVLLILAEDISLKDNPWLLISLLVYAIALVFAIVVQNPNSEKLLGLLSSATPGEAPSAEVSDLGNRLRMGGTMLGVAIIILVVLMVFKPGA